MSLRNKRNSHADDSVDNDGLSTSNVKHPLEDFVFGVGDFFLQLNCTPATGRLSPIPLLHQVIFLSGRFGERGT